ncbi:hypothetical protein MWU54_07545 [Marivita sp. S6314]|uniref:hypothetical protein n=1 Tax=Marivita sp. S6314 TaxID=2926406 RepID=UPI001FF5E018|nr:hypothetical protein [Marivita sp. S6314]MCK0149870.1 hypothetical protein [Marivita sp. S6314]
MVITFLTSMILVISVLLVLSNLGTVVDDTAKAVRGAMQRLRVHGGLASFVAFGVLWITIFGLGFV